MPSVAERTGPYRRDVIYNFDPDPATHNILYVGMASPGTRDTDAGWAIMQFNYSGTDITNIKWANGRAMFENIWNSRATYSYL